MFGPVMMECKVCEQEFEADLEAHGPGVCIISFDCGHTMHATKEETRWVNTKTGNVDLVEKEKQIKGHITVRNFVAKNDFNRSSVHIDQKIVGA
ncbi:hypothetical protein SP41_140 [Salmonella phage 41]|nr:hypothetical protein SP41_140 [Salmonella phage 41]